ncbi:amidase [Brevibacillus reuszeri]|uniref:amidase n=1 Tax=Brevibacillus reuszeri TaxID=54915 RepID=UPI003D1F325B
MHELAYLSAVKVGTLIRERKVSAEEITRLAIQRISKFNPQLNAVVAKNEEAALHAAKEADKEIHAGQLRGPLHGVPITIKDSFSTIGLATTSGIPALQGFVPDRDAAVVSRLKQAGVVLLGKTNVSPLLIDIQTDNDIYGRTNNPWNQERTAGGSSGGSAASVAAGLSYLDIGSDIGGSLRLPAHYCGVFSLKPTEGAVPPTGHMPGFEGTADYASSRHLACYGPLARSIEDLQTAFSIIAGGRGSAGGLPNGPQVPPPTESATPLRVAWLDELPGYPVSHEIQEALHRFVTQLAGQGIHVDQITAPPIDVRTAWETWGKMIDAELNSTTPMLQRGLAYLTTRKVSQKVPTASMLVPLTFKNYMRVLTVREQLIRRFELFMSDYDVLLCPVSSTTAFPHHQKTKMVGYLPIYEKPLYIDGKPQNYWIATTYYANLFNVTGSPVVTMPIGFDKAGLPIGIQCVGKRWRDHDLLSTAARMSQTSQEWKPPTL